MTFHYKRVLPVIFFGAPVAFLVPALMHPEGIQSPLIFAVPFVFGILVYSTLRQLVFGLVDQVWDDGDALLIHNGRKEERVALKNILNVSYSKTNPPRVTLTLREPCGFGKEVAFVPLNRFLNFTTHPIVGELIERIDAQRRAL